MCGVSEELGILLPRPNIYSCPASGAAGLLVVRCSPKAYRTVKTSINVQLSATTCKMLHASIEIPIERDRFVACGHILWVH